MKTVAIGDIHGHNGWKEIVNQNSDADLFVFIGDYLDSFTITGVEQLHNLKEIIEFKLSNPNKVILLCGNHEYHYLSGIPNGTHYSGYQNGMSWDFKYLLDPLVQNGQLVIAHESQGFLFTHAGLTSSWCMDNNLNENNIVDEVNMLFKYSLKNFAVCTSQFYGDNTHEGPLWVRPPALKSDFLPNFHHIVGHTPTKHIEINENITLIDTLRYEEYLIIENGVMQVAKIVKKKYPHYTHE